MSTMVNCFFSSECSQDPSTVSEMENPKFIDLENTGMLLHTLAKEACEFKINNMMCNYKVL